MGRLKRIRDQPVDEAALKKQVSRNLLDIEAELGKSPKEMAKLLGMPWSTYKNWRYGASYPQGDGVIRLYHMGINTNYLFSGVGPIRRPVEEKPAATRGKKKAAPAKRRIAAAE